VDIQARFDTLARGLATNRLSRGQVLKTFATGLLLAGPLGAIKATNVSAAGTCSDTKYSTCLNEADKDVDNYIRETCKPRGSRSGNRFQDGSAMYALSCTWWANNVLKDDKQEKCAQQYGCPAGGDVCCGGVCCESDKCCEGVCCGANRKCCNGGCVPELNTCTSFGVFCSCNDTCYEDVTVCLNECHGGLGCLGTICGPAQPGQCPGPVA
jgi:hypothetical protein